MARDEVWASAGRIAQRAKRDCPTSLHGLSFRCHCGKHLARPKTISGVRFVLQRQIKQDIYVLCEGGGGLWKPGREAVGVHRNA